MTVAFREDPRSELGLALLRVPGPRPATPGAPLCLERRAGSWWFTDSLYPAEEWAAHAQRLAPSSVEQLPGLASAAPGRSASG